MPGIFRSEAGKIDELEPLGDAGLTLRFAEAHDLERQRDIARHGSPRIERRSLELTAIEGTEITAETATRAMVAFGIGENGLDELDWRILVALTTSFAGRPVGLDALAQSLDVDATTISAEHEGNLVRCGLISRTKGGRLALPPAYDLVRGK